MTVKVAIWTCWSIRFLAPRSSTWAAIGARFGATVEAAARCELFAWRATPEGRLAEILVLDQFSRNVYRDTPRSFAQHALALVLAQELVSS